jgi:hypothetical protein
VINDPFFLLAVSGLGLSAVVSAIRLIDWFIHSDPKAIAQTGRWAVVGLAALSVPLLLSLVFSQKWTAASALAAVMLLAFALYGPRMLRLVPRRLVPDWSPPATNGTGDSVASDSELIQRSIAVLEEYLQRTAAISVRRETDLQAVVPNGRTGNGNGREHKPVIAPMSVGEALDVLELPPDATELQISDAHRRLVGLVDPGRGGSHYLTIKINQAKDVLLGEAGARLRPNAEAPPRKRGRRRPQQPQS